MNDRSWPKMDIYLDNIICDKEVKMLCYHTEKYFKVMKDNFGLYMVVFKQNYHVLRCYAPTLSLRQFHKKGY